jgi:hypothetical protein
VGGKNGSVPEVEAYICNTLSMMVIEMRKSRSATLLLISSIYSLCILVHWVGRRKPYLVVDGSLRGRLLSLHCPFVGEAAFDAGDVLGGDLV